MKNTQSPTRFYPAKKNQLYNAIIKGSGELTTTDLQHLREDPDVDFVSTDPERQLLGARFCIDESKGEGYWDFYRIGKDVFVVANNFTFSEIGTACYPGESLLEFHLRLTGNLTLSTHRTDPVQVEGPSLLVWNQPEGIDCGAEVEPDTAVKSISIFCRPSFIINNLLEDSNVIPLHLAKFILNDSGSVNYCQLPLTPDLIDAAAKLVEADRERYKGPLWLIHGAAKTMELLCMIISVFESLSTAADESYNESDLERFRQARDIVAKEFDPTPTIKQVAHRVGTNETKLKTGFKALFGVTVHEYRHHLRMQRATQLLSQGNLSIGLVAEQVGYQHQTTFTRAFKAYSGISPKDYRKVRSGVTTEPHPSSD